VSAVLNFRLSLGWRSENKRSGEGDISETASAYFSKLEDAESAMARFIAGCDKHSSDRGDYWWHDFAEIEQIDDEGEIIGQPVKSWRSKPQQEVAS